MFQSLLKHSGLICFSLHKLPEFSDWHIKTKISACSQICILLQFLGSVVFIFWNSLISIPASSAGTGLVPSASDRVWAPDHVTALWSHLIFLIILLLKRMPTSGPFIPGAASGRMSFMFLTEVLPATRHVSHSFQFSRVPFGLWDIFTFYEPRAGPRSTVYYHELVRTASFQPVRWSICPVYSSSAVNEQWGKHLSMYFRRLCSMVFSAAQVTAL